MSKPSVRVELGRSPAGNHVWVGDVEVTSLVTAVRIECNSKGGFVSSVSLDLVPGEIRVDGDLVEAIQPVLRQPKPGKAIAYRHTGEDGQQWDLVYDTNDVASVETQRNVVDITQPDDTAHRRELGQTHMHVHFKEGHEPRWVPAGDHSTKVGEGDAA